MTGARTPFPRNTLYHATVFNRDVCFCCFNCRCTEFPFSPYQGVVSVALLLTWPLCRLIFKANLLSRTVCLNTGHLCRTGKVTSDRRAQRITCLLVFCAFLVKDLIYTHTRKSTVHSNQGVDFWVAPKKKLATGVPPFQKWD